MKNKKSAENYGKVLVVSKDGRHCITDGINSWWILSLMGRGYWKHNDNWSEKKTIKNYWKFITGEELNTDNLTHS